GPGRADPVPVPGALAPGLPAARSIGLANGVLSGARVVALRHQHLPRRLGPRVPRPFLGAVAQELLAGLRHPRPPSSLRPLAPRPLGRALGAVLGARAGERLPPSGAPA